MCPFAPQDPPPRHTTEVELPEAVPQGAVGATLTLNLTRSTILDVRLVDGPDEIVIEPGKLQRVMHVRSEKLQAFAGQRIEVEYEGDTPSLSEIQWRYAGDAFDERSDEDLFDERKAAVDALPEGILKSYQLFFYEYDRETNTKVALLPDDGRDVPIDNLSRAMCWRILEKARKYESGEWTDIPDGTTPDEKDWVRYLSELQLDLFRGHFGGVEEPENVTGMQLAFELFASGKLRLSDEKIHLNAEPDGAAFFKFAEFALMAAQYVEDSSQSGFWLQLGRTLAWVQQVYAYFYPAPETKLYHDYRVSNFDKTLDALPPEILYARQSYWQANLVGLHALTARNAYESFRGEVSLTLNRC